MQRFFLIELGLVILGSVILALIQDLMVTFSFAVGGLIVLGNVLLLAFVMRAVLRKKLIALAVIVSVMKYAILGLILYHLTNMAGFHAIWFGAGVGTLVVASVLYALTVPEETGVPTEENDGI